VGAHFEFFFEGRDDLSGFELSVISGLYTPRRLQAIAYGAGWFILWEAHFESFSKAAMICRVLS